MANKNNLKAYSHSGFNSDLYPLDGLYGPWDNWNSFYEGIFGGIDNIEADKGLIQPGVTVGIIENNKVVEYWKETSNGDFVKKSTSGSNGKDGIDGVDGKSVSVKSSTKVNGVSTVVLTDGTTDTTLTIKDGTDGKDGVDGKDGEDSITSIASDSKSYVSITDKLLSLNIGNISSNKDGLCTVSDVYAYIDKMKQELINLINDKDSSEESTELQYIVGLSKDNLKNTNISGTTFVIPDEYDTITMPEIGEKTIFGDSDSYYTKYVSGTIYHTWFILVPNTVTVKIEDGINGEGGPLNDATKVDATATLKGVTYNVYLNYYPLGIKGSVARITRIS